MERLWQEVTVRISWLVGKADAAAICGVDRVGDGRRFWLARDVGKHKRLCADVLVGAHPKGTLREIAHGIYGLLSDKLAKMAG